MAIGSLTLTPEFNSDVTAYTTTTSNLSDVITATATDEDSTIVITNGETIVANGGSAIWSNGANTVSVVVTNGGKTKTYTVTVTKPVTAKLSNLTIGNLTLTPEFDGDTTSYTVSTENATNTITATALEVESTITILNGETPVENGTAATWEDGENTVSITVTNGNETKTYTVLVTKS